MITKNYASGQIIFKQGDYSDCMYDILSGSVGIYSAYGTPEQKLVAELQAGQLLGEMGMLEYYPRSATAAALEDGATLAAITEDELSVYFRDKPEKLLKIMRQLSKSLRETTQKYADACRVVYETAEAEKQGRAKSEELLSNIFYYVDLYSNTLLF